MFQVLKLMGNTPTLEAIYSATTGQFGVKLSKIL
ncbi:hypothetical protein T11_2089 [Trichinella zimbabwensis]|uniref:Uncharacterized protein n=1 Tax=Trichinella zimbabwensis TaxID=268475 RepID=A0A0V1G713_9BILA|nr:hypothetical protein T11_2089 [Trichinella zimbabwensis]